LKVSIDTLASRRQGTKHMSNIPKYKNDLVHLQRTFSLPKYIHIYIECVCGHLRSIHLCPCMFDHLSSEL
jgi:hypothetical protein